MAEKATVAARNSAWRIMSPRWSVVRHVLAGTEALRAAGTEFLPRHQEESLVNYQDRLLGTVLVNTTELVTDTLVGRVFKVPLEPESNVPAGVSALFPDVDLTGTGLNPFCREWFYEGLAMGVSHVLVDMQAPDWEPPPGVPRTLADDRKDGLRPYWYRVSPENVIAAFTTRENGKEVLTHVRIAETSVERAGFGEAEVTRIRVLERDHWELWEPVDMDKQGEEDEWQKVAEGPNALGVIPLVTFYTGMRDKQAFVCKPPLLDLAYLNVAHWCSSSDQRSILTVARFPILAVSGVAQEEVVKLKIGPREWLVTPDASGKWYYVEHTGRAILAGERDLAKLEDQMAAYGAEFLRAKPGVKSATERILDEAGTISPLEAMALDFQDALKQALDLTALWLKADRAPGEVVDGGTVTVVVDVTEEEANQVALEALFRARAARDISRRAYLRILVNRGILPEDFDHDADLEELANEPEFGMPERGVDPETDPGASAKNQPTGGAKAPNDGAQTAPGGDGQPRTVGANLPRVDGRANKGGAPPRPGGRRPLARGG